MPSLLSGSKLRTGGSGEFLKLANAMPQLPQSPTTSTGYTIVTNSLLQSSYSSSLGNIQFYDGQAYSNVASVPLTFIGTGTNGIVVRANNPINSTSTLIVQGGAFISSDLDIGGSILANTSSFLTLTVTGNVGSISSSTGALRVFSGVGIGENLNVGGNFNTYNTATVGLDLTVGRDLTVNRELTVAGQGAVTLTPQAASIFLQPTLGGTVVIQPSETGNIDDMIIGKTVARDGYFNNLVAYNATITNALKVGGPVTINNSATLSNSVYSQDGIAEYNNLLYTPKVTISTTAPSNPRIGDFWINPTYGVECQYVNDGGNFIWIQFTGF